MASSVELNSAGGLGAGIRRLRLARGLTQREVAAPRYTRAFLAAIEAGIRTPSDDALLHIASQLQVAVDDLRFGRPPRLEEELRDTLTTARRTLAQGEVRKAERAAHQVAADADRYGLPELVSAAHFLMGDIHLHRGQMRAASAEFDQAADAMPTNPPAPLAAMVTGRRAYSQFVAGNATRAVAMLEDKLRELRSAATLSPDAELRVITGMLYIFVELDMRDRARRLESEAAPLLPRVTTIEWVAQFYTMAAQLRREDAELADAERLLSLAVPLYEELGLTREIGVCHWVRGYVMRRAGRLAGAVGEFQIARKIFHEIGAVQDHAGVTCELAEVRRRQGEFAEADRLAAAAGRICRASRHTEGMAESDRVRGLIAGQTGDPDTAERLLRRAADRYESAGFFAEVVTTCRELGELLLAHGRAAEAATAFRRGLHNAEKLR